MLEAPAINREEALANIGGDEDMLLEFFRMYDEETLNPQALRLHKGIMKKDFEEIRIGGYLIKATAGYIGANKFRELGLELETKGRNKESIDSIIRDYMELLNEARKLKKEIAFILKRPVSLDIIDFDIFEDQLKTAYPKNFPDAKVSPICDGCNIF